MLDASPSASPTPSTCNIPGCLTPATLCNGEGDCRVHALARWVDVTLPARCRAAAARYEALAGGKGTGTAAEWRALGEEFHFLSKQFPARSPRRALHEEYAKFAWGRADRLMAPVAGPVATFRKWTSSRQTIPVISDVEVAS